jgi:hypothetical protein
MARPWTAVIGVAVVAAAASVVLLRRDRADVDARSGAGPRGAASPSPASEAGAEGGPPDDAGADADDLDSSAGAAMPDGATVPPLPAGAPRQVRFGVVLVSYAGAQPGPGGVHPATRSKADAWTLAERLRQTAAEDFHAAVQQGDPGSADDVGRVKPGILEPAPEYILFTMPVDAVGGPVDTPRGYWIVKRVE